MRMRANTSGRAGYAPHKPHSPSVAKHVPTPPTPPSAELLDALRAELAAFFAAHNQLAPAAAIAGWDVDELRGLEVGPTTDALGVHGVDAARLVSKVRGLLARLRLLDDEVGGVCGAAGPSAA